MSTVADNLNAVADMIDKGHMWCKSEWSELREFATNPMEGDSERVGCAEGLLCERLGLFDGMTESARFQIRDGEVTKIWSGMILKLLWEDEEELGGDCYFISELRSTEEWKVLQKTILEAGEIDLESTDEENVVICWNDSEKTTAEDAATMFRKAALVADEQVS